MSHLPSSLAPVALAWLRLGHAPRAAMRLRTELRRHVPDLAALGTLLARLLDGDDALVQPRGPLTPDAAALLRGGAARRAVDRALDWVAGAADRHLLTLDDPRYPEAVACLEDAPPVLALRGDPACLAAPGLAMVGSRRATVRGLQLADEFAAALAPSGIAIVSGLAYGIDAAAHEAALRVGGLTLAVVATGPDRVYPARHAGLARRIAERGAVLTENPCGFELMPYHFPHRNRLISALSLGTLVVEAGDPSGSLSTATHAHVQGRAIMAIPGAPGRAASAGCHRVIRDGGTLVTCPADVAGALHAHIERQLEHERDDAAIERARASRRAAALERRRRAGPVGAHAALVEGLDKHLTPNANEPPATPPHWSGLAGPERPSGFDDGGDAHRVHAAMDEDGLSVDALAHRTGLPMARLSVALARLEIHALVRRDGAGGYVPCKPRS